MRVGLDYLPAVTHAPGIGRYARELVRAMVRLPGAPELALLEIGGGKRSIGEPMLGLAGARVRRVRARLPRRAAALLARAGWTVERVLGGVDVFHRTQAEWPPLRDARQVLAIPELPPRGSPGEERLAERARAIDALLAFSSHYERELVARLGVPAARVRRVEVGCDHWVRDLGGARVAKPARPRVLVLGAVRVEREPVRVLAGFERLLARGRAAELVLAGRPGAAAPAFEEALARSGARAFVRWVRAPDERAMPELVAGSSVLVHLARDEGTPVTPLEACAMGLAVLASPLPAFVEALGDLGRWCAPDATADELGRAMDEALDDAADPARAEARRALAARHTWSGNADRTLAIWRELAGIDGGAPTAADPGA